MSVFIRLIIFIIIGIVAGKIYNKILIKCISGKIIKTLCALTMVIFILSSIILSAAISIKSYANSEIRKYAVKMEQEIYDILPNNELLRNGIDLNKIDDDISQVTEFISSFQTLIPDNSELKVNKMIYDFLINSVTKLLQSEISTIIYSANIYGISIRSIVDDNNCITVSSILNYFTKIVEKEINTIFLDIIIKLMIPLFIYIIATLIYAFYSYKTDNTAVTASSIPHFNSNENKPIVENNVSHIEKNISQKDWIAVLLFCIFLGTLGVHRFYAGKIGTGILMLLTLGGLGIWWIIDLIMIITSQFTDKSGQKISGKDYF
jgi:TM2 domain-containing membrane protein YozV